MRKFLGFGLIFACFFSLSGVCSAMNGGGCDGFPGSFLGTIDAMSDSSSSDDIDLEIFPFQLTFDDSIDSIMEQSDADLLIPYDMLKQWIMEDSSDMLLDQNGAEIFVSPVSVSRLTKDDPWIQRVFSGEVQEFDCIAANDSPNKLDEAINNMEHIVCNSKSSDLVERAQEVLDYAKFADSSTVEFVNSSTQYSSPIEDAIHRSSQRDTILFSTDMLKSEFGESN